MKIDQKAKLERRVGVAEAKSKLSEVLREVAEGPTVIHNRGRDLAVILAMEDYRRLTAGQSQRTGGAEFLRRVEILKERYDGGTDDFEPARLDFVPVDPFA